MPEERKNAYEVQRQARIAALKARETQEKIHRKILLKLGLLGVSPMRVSSSRLRMERREREEVKEGPLEEKRKEAKTPFNLGL